MNLNDSSEEEFFNQPEEKKKEKKEKTKLDSQRNIVSQNMMFDSRAEDSERLSYIKSTGRNNEFDSQPLTIEEKAIL